MSHLRLLVGGLMCAALTVLVGCNSDSHVSPTPSPVTTSPVVTPSPTPTPEPGAPTANLVIEHFELGPATYFQGWYWNSPIFTLRETSRVSDATITGIVLGGTHLINCWKPSVPAGGTWLSTDSIAYYCLAQESSTPPTAMPVVVTYRDSAGRTATVSATSPVP